MMILKLLAHIFKWPLVYTRDFDSDVRIRRVKHTPFDEYTVTGILGSTRCILLSDGTVSGKKYVKNWKPINKYGRMLAMKLKMEN